MKADDRISLKTRIWYTHDGNTKRRAEEVILAAFDTRPTDLEWRFNERREASKSPFTDRFPRGDWMVWS